MQHACMCYFADRRMSGLPVADIIFAISYAIALVSI